MVQTPGIASQSSKAVLVQADGKIVAAGMTTLGKIPILLINQFVAVRYAADGSLDSGFGTAGIASTGVETVSVTNQVDRVLGTALQPDGKIVVAGIIGGFDGETLQCALVRFNVDGSSDSNFGTGGLVVDSRIGLPACISVAVQPNGKIVLGDESFGVRRLNQDGSRDLSFGLLGEATPGTNPGTSAAMLLQPDGRIVLIGWSFFLPPFGGPVGSLVLLRYNADGTLDPSFGSSGVARPEGIDDIKLPSYAAGALQSDGKIIVASNSPGKGLVRLNTNGSLDSTFGTAGIATAGYAFAATGVALQPNGKIVVSGYGWPNNPNPPTSEFMAARFNTNGTLDSGFGTAGQVHTPVGSAAFANASVVQTDGRIVLAGYATVLDQFVLALARFFGDPTQ